MSFLQIVLNCDIFSKQSFTNKTGRWGSPKVSGKIINYRSTALALCLGSMPLKSK